jgi:(4-alkanoyl-5-oxo-2,5-dihydrofuran-3-yl)methyl phosphate reductase
MSTILVTGARGNIGARVVDKLVASGAQVRVLLRQPHAAFDRPSVKVIQGSYDDAAAVASAMTGVSRALFITAGPELARHDGVLALAARAAGVEHVVKLSVAGARGDGSEVPRWHHDGEQRIAATGVATTFLRPGSFALNALRWLPTLRSMGKAFGAFGTAALPVIHPDDIADVAVLALTKPGHAGKVYELTGPEALTAAEQVAILSEVAGSPFQYVNVDDEVAVRGMLDAGMPRQMADAMIHLVQALRGLGRLPPNDVVPQLLGKPARTFRQWASENAATFKGKAST